MRGSFPFGMPLARRLRPAPQAWWLSGGVASLNHRLRADDPSGVFYVRYALSWVRQFRARSSRRSSGRVVGWKGVVEKTDLQRLGWSCGPGSCRGTIAGSERSRGVPRRVREWGREIVEIRLLMSWTALEKRLNGNTLARGPFWRRQASFRRLKQSFRRASLLCRSSSVLFTLASFLFS
jgi:hypothetical protein